MMALYIQVQERLLVIDRWLECHPMQRRDLNGRGP